MDAMVWLIKQDLVVQVRIRARVFARPGIKKQAWRRLWYRRREKWLKGGKHRKASTTSGATGSSSRNRDYDETPKAGINGYEAVDPLDATVPPPKTEVSYLEYDPDLEMDSDSQDGESAETAEDVRGMMFSEDQEHPSEIPKFEGSFIFHPSRAQKDEARWLRVIREHADDVWASKFDL